MAGYIGSATAVVSNGGEKKVTVTASGGQTAISNVSYAPGQVDVYHNGVRLVDGTDYTATNGTSITLTVAAAANDQIVVRSFNTFQVSDNVSASGGGSFAADVTFATGADIITSSLGTSNFRAGVNAGNSITSGGNYNVAVGDEAGTAITTGDNNVAVGYLSLDALTTATSNVAIGAQALSVNILGSLSTAVGYSSLENQNYTTATDSHNTAVGFKAGHNVTTGVENTLIGSLAGDAITTGEENAIVGYLSGSSLTDADFNCVLGTQALATDTKGSRSIAIGQGALNAQNFTTSTDSRNTAVGNHAGLSVTTGQNNTLVGHLAGDALTDADFNVAIGSEALTGDTLGSRSVAIGQHALQIQNFTTATEVYNVAVGYDAGVSVSTGIKNTLIGGLAGNEISTGSYNTFVGFSTGTYTVNAAAASSNVIVGAFSDTTAVNSNEAMGLGYNIDCAAGYTTLGAGASDIRAAHGNVTWATVSDQRYKKEIVDSTAGLSFINALQPRTFKYKNLGELPEAFSAYEADSTEVFKNSHTNHGFIAQEVKAAIDADSSIKDGFRLWDDREDGSQEVAEAALIPMLTKAVQELSTALDAALARITTLEG